MHAAGHTGSIIWYPKNYTTSASATHKVECNGSNTTSNYCAIQKSQYRWTSQNNSWLGGTAIVYTTLTLYN